MEKIQKKAAPKAAPRAATAVAPIALMLADGKPLVPNATGKTGSLACIALRKGDAVALPLFAKARGEKGGPTPTKGSVVVTSMPYDASVVSTKLSDWPPIGACDGRKASALDRRAFTIGTIVGGDRDGQRVVVAWFDAVESSKTTTACRQPAIDAQGRQVAAVVALANAMVVL